ncbi:OLC1v1030670C1 [Oldenlandia corymbosa var. corymbosa]|uniref:OLC1v1030670C1 n=1 Tax=Oldenlandia corymbosa var. corymbosa TaxID=529605 RepID=A0AAV1CJJ8_OLDCO|nr:OLC1v1030670C1 [Oldenlandia corymbosa var. corymbosa]
MLGMNKDLQWTTNDTATATNDTRKIGMPHIDTIQEVETDNDKEEVSTHPPLQVLDQLRINVDLETLVGTLKSVYGSLMSDLSFSKNKLKEVEGRF